LQFNIYSNGTSLYFLHARAGQHTAEVAQKDFAFRKIKYFGFVLCVCVCGGGDYIYRLHHIAAEIDADHGFLM
jgi:hypothetical protein